jgi:hypothetical protein
MGGQAETNTVAGAASTLEFERAALSMLRQAETMLGKVILRDAAACRALWGTLAAAFIRERWVWDGVDRGRGAALGAVGGMDSMGKPTTVASLRSKLDALFKPLRFQQYRRRPIDRPIKLPA